MTGRAVLAVLLTIGFYVLAIGLAVALLAVPYFEWTGLHRINIRITIFCLAGAAIILLSILPTFEHFRIPGEPASQRTHPRLFAELSAIARAVGEPLPEEVYLVQDVNAGVRQRGGIMGVGGRRVMLLGVPLMRILRVSEFRAVVAHEFGHYRGGHTQLAPWIYKTREAIGRTLTHLSGHSAMLMWPFLQYGHLFLSITQDISRQQEFEADLLAARVAGARAFIAGLRGVYGASFAYAHFCRQNTAVYADALTPRPAPDENFMRFLHLPHTGDAIRKAMEDELAHPRLDPYDSHPPLATRIAALEKLPPGVDSSTEPLAAALLDPIVSANAAVPTSAPVPTAAPLAGALPWEDAGAGGEQFRWDDDVRRNFHILRGWTVGTLPDLAPSVGKVGGKLGTRWVADEEAARSGRALLAGALGLALVRAGWVIEASATGHAVVRKGDVVVDPMKEIEQLTDGSMDAAGWRARATAMGISSLRLDALRRAA
ncbi:MAG TPA: M48 family metallopeptidase [Candidatus Dormibacteraeota bacterium]|nr:M48 family metallopeptidase [Candidatus Dormibacteraeota bacterium]